jgi:hypothetical protein
MRKYLFIIAFILFRISSFGQSISFDDLRQLTHKKDVNAFLTGRNMGFVKTNSIVPVDTYVKNEQTPNEEKIEYDKRGIGYSTKNSQYLKAIMKQIKYGLILKDEDKKGGHIFYQYGDTHLVITIDFYKNSEIDDHMSIVEK